MMKARYHMNNLFEMVEFPKNEEGLKSIKQFRKDHKQFKFQRIYDVLQAFPEDVPFGEVLQLSNTHRGGRRI